MDYINVKQKPSYSVPQSVGFVIYNIVEDTLLEIFPTASYPICLWLEETNYIISEELLDIIIDIVLHNDESIDNIQAERIVSFVNNDVGWSNAVFVHTTQYVGINYYYPPVDIEKNPLEIKMVSYLELNFCKSVKIL